MAKTSRKSLFPAGSWYLKAIGLERAAETRARNRAPKPRSAEADAQAVTYAEWLMARDGVNLDAERAAAVAAIAPAIVKRRGRPDFDSNASLRDMVARAKPHPKVRWKLTDHGYRPRFVDFYEFRGSHPDDLIHTVELPHWDAAWEVVTDLSEPEIVLAA